MALKRITVNKKKGKQFLIHWSGGASFVVQVFNKKMIIYTSKYSPDIEADKEVYRTTFNKLFIPSSLKPGDPEPADLYNIGLAGNSLLAHIDSNRYIYVGHDVVEVILDEPVESYYSELDTGFAGNKIFKIPSDAPLAYAITPTYVYCFHTWKRYDRAIFPSLRDIIPPLNPPSNYVPSLKSDMKKTAKRMNKEILVKFVSY